MPMTHDAVEDYFTYRTPDEGQIVAMNNIRNKAKELAHVILDETPQCPDQTLAIQKLREVVMRANLGVMFRGL